MTPSLLMFAAGILLIASGFKGKSLAETLRGDLGSIANPGTGFARIFDVGPFREREEGAPSGGAGMTTVATHATGTAAGGARGIVNMAANVAADHGNIQVISAKRPGATTTSGNVSDHSQDDDERAARDLSNTGNHGTSPEMDAAVEAIGAAFGQRINGKREVVKTFHWHGFRIQLLYRTQVGGNHDGHIHVGARAE